MMQATTTSTTTSAEADDPVRFSFLPTACGRRFAIATLHAPATLNALSLPMVQLLTPALRDWAQDDTIAGVILQASGDKAFCAGGDLQALYQSMRQHGSAPNPFAHTFFAQEYALDQLIHTYAKPILCWGHGIVMGGGMGLMAGASHRVVTPASRLAMPEISVGLYPDVGGSWVLRRLPGRSGLFLALTGAQVNASDALFTGLADFCLLAEDRDRVFKAIAARPWGHGPAQHRAGLSRVLASMAVPIPAPGPLRTHFDTVQALMAGEDLLDIAVRLRAQHSDDPWLAGAAKSFQRGSPTSAALAFALWQRVPHLSLAEVFRLEYRVSLGCCAHPDFAEGIRALLIDKDRRPQWTPARLEDITPAWIEEHFAARSAPPDAAALSTDSHHTPWRQPT